MKIAPRQRPRSSWPANRASCGISGPLLFAKWGRGGAPVSNLRHAFVVVREEGGEGQEAG